MSNKLSVLTATGRKEIVWTVGDEAAVAEARAAFNLAQESGMALFARLNGSAEIVEEFDPETEDIYAIPPIAGG